MARYEVTSDRLPAKRGEVVDLDPAEVNIPALLAASHIKPAAEQQPETSRRGARGGDVRTR